MNFIQATTESRRRPGEIRLHGPEAFEAMRKAGRLVAEALDLFAGEVKAGVSTARLDELAFRFGMDHGAYPATLNYRGYMKSTCISINEVVCHGIPDRERILRDGDILNIDVTYVVDGWHGDSSRMYCVGEVKPFAARLVRATHEALMRGIDAIKPGATTRDIGAAIQRYAESERFSVVEDFCGHGVGRLFHDEPNILHYAVSRKTKPWQGRTQEQIPDIPLKPGMIFTVEPMINLGRPDVKVLKKSRRDGDKQDDGWTAVTVDGKLSAQFEHSVGVTETGCEVFTFSPRGWHQPPYPA